MPVEESAPGSLADDYFPAAYHLKLTVPEGDFLELALVKHVCIHEVQAVRNHGLPQLVVAAFVAFNDNEHELRHVLLHLTLLHGEDILHAFLELSGDKLARVPVDQDHPLVNEELLRLEFDLYGLQYLNCLNDYRESGLWHRCIVLLEQKEVHLEGALYLGSQLDTT